MFKVKTTKTLFFHVDFILEFNNDEKLEIEEDYLMLVKKIADNIRNETGQNIVPVISLGYRIEDPSRIAEHFSGNDMGIVRDVDCLENIMTISGSSIDNCDKGIEEWKRAVILFCETIYRQFKRECDAFSIKIKQDNFSVNFRYMDTHFSSWNDSSEKKSE